MEKFHGALVALVTPFIDGQMDEQGLIDLIEFQIEQWYPRHRALRDHR